MRLGARAKPAAKRPGSQTAPELSDAAWRRKCFYSSPIGVAGSEQRQHSDALLNFLIGPAVAALDPSMEVVRADHLSSSPITAAVFEHVFRAGLFIADLSFHNPNVFHEIGARHTSGGPCVLVSRTADRIPANLRDERVVLVNTSTIGAFHAELEERRAEVTSYARWALSSEGRDSSPVQKLFPNYRRYIR